MSFTYIKLFSRHLFPLKSHTNAIGRFLPIYYLPIVSNIAENTGKLYKYEDKSQAYVKEQIAYEFRQDERHIHENVECLRNTTHIGTLYSSNGCKITLPLRNKWMSFAKNHREPVNESCGMHTNIQYVTIFTRWNSIQSPFSISSRNISTLKRRIFKIKKHKKKKRKKKWSRMDSIPWKPSSEHKITYQLPCKIRRIVKERRRRKKGNRTIRAPRQR